MKRTKRLTVLLCLILVAASVVASFVCANNINFGKADTAVEAPALDNGDAMVPSEGSLAEENGEVSQNIVSADAIDATLMGNIPEGVKLSSSFLTEKESADALGEKFSDDSSTVLTGFDITFNDPNGDEWQPNEGEKVLVSMDISEYGNFLNGTHIVVAHKHGDGEVETLGAFPVVDGKVMFETPGFSTFWLVMGSDDFAWDLFCTNSNWENSVGGDANRHFYVIPGIHSLTLTNKTGTVWYVNDNGQDSAGNGAITDYKWSGTHYGDFSWGGFESSQIGHTAHLSNNGINFYVHVVDYRLYGQACLTNYGTSGTYGDHARNFSNYPYLYFNCINNPSSGLPGVAANNFTAYPHTGIAVSYLSIYGSGSGSENYMTGIYRGSSVSSNIFNVAGNNGTVSGVFDPSGSTITNYVNNMRFDINQGDTTSCGLYYLATLNSIVASDGRTLTTSNWKNYRLIPYLFKFDYSNWRYDLNFYVAPADASVALTYTLSYTWNVPGGTTPSGLTIPSNSSSYSYINTSTGAFVPRGTAYVSTTPVVGQSYLMADGSTYTFNGWAYNGTTYAANTQIALNSDVPLYGTWTQVILNFSLTITVSGADLELDEEQSFVFSLTGAGVDVTFMVAPNSSVTFADLPKGEYTITSTDWAWRYENTSGTYTVNLTQDTTASYVVTRNKTQWLDDNAYVKLPS